MEHFSIDEEIRQFGASVCEFRIRVERMRYAFERVEFRRNLHLTELFEEALAALDRDRDVRSSMENHG